ncbi:MAG: LacI family DNA-binding transcriptional regulator [Paenibacillaceae bacterium]|uniref:LacI family DNA-binding transcriptional regulator n=1 Tax=Paenibacillus mellifer TaxID=2937794 RepID=A0A9X1XYQ8_9BACL|nr:LacI family DNA-binding transcriptional regulator [Paenibacillus mellifer]MBW4837864.1 LacI family DNA-binding transcriptional regulator [Paenibacillaceae bacterium]MCK8487782.1 LacI family DNA-binding transcriptional regulator [Paenibacillus mellifer]
MGRKKKISMQDIADHLQISKNAVSLALMNKKGVSEEMRQLVQQTAREMGYGPYAPQESGKANILVLVPERIMSYQDNDHFQFFHDMIWGLERSARKKGFNAVITPLDRETEISLSLPGPFADIPYRGVILFAITDRAYAKRIWELDTPLVLMDSYYRDLPCPAVTSGNLEGAHVAVTHLIEAGHQRIGFIGPTNLSTSHEERWFGYEKAMKEQGLSIRDADCLTISQGYDCTKVEMAQFLDGLGEWPTAFFCGNDRIAYLLAGLLKERNKRLPEDVSIAGFDDLPYVNVEGLNMTTMRVEKERMCDAAINLLLSELGRTRESIHWQVQPTLVVRDSVALR